MKVSEEYFQRLAHSSDSLSAVHELDGFWCARVRLGNIDRQLSEHEHNVHLCLVYVAEVGNGGHSQFFLNPSGGYSAETGEALRRLDLRDLAMALADASEVFPGGVVPRNNDERTVLVEQMDPNDFLRWEPLDRIVHRAEPWDRLLNYVRENQNRILVKERA